jgi:hypothetical protein
MLNHFEYNLDEDQLLLRINFLSLKLYCSPQDANELNTISLL